MRLEKTKALAAAPETISETVLVVGGGRAGLEAALGRAGLGHPAVLVERSATLGGRLAAQVSVVPEHPPYDAPHANPLPELIRQVAVEPRHQGPHLGSILKIAGQPGPVRRQPEGPGESQETMRVGAIVQATGARPYDATRRSATSATARRPTS